MHSLPSSSLLGALILLAGLAGALFILGSLLRRLHRLPTPADEFHLAPTPDGWLLALYRYRPAPPAGVDPPHASPLPVGAAVREPVILCHGMLSNRFSLDLDEEHSLARYLRGAGFDVWVMELRGHGGSRRAATGRIRPFDWTVDDYVRTDLPTVVAYVRRATAAPAVHWVGHSLGGMILYAACALDRADGIRAAVLGDVPAGFPEDRRVGWFGRLYVRLIPIVPPFLFIPFVMVLGLISPSLLLPKYGIRDRRTMLRIVANGIIDLGCTRVARQLVDLVLLRRFLSADRSIDYETGVERMRFPVLQLAAVSRRSPEAVVRAIIDRAPSEHKAYVRVGRGAGFSRDYNHFTLLFGEQAPREVFPLVARFLAEHSGPSGA